MDKLPFFHTEVFIRKPMEYTTINLTDIEKHAKLRKRITDSIIEHTTNTNHRYPHSRHRELVKILAIDGVSYIGRIRMYTEDFVILDLEKIKKYVTIDISNIVNIDSV